MVVALSAPRGPVSRKYTFFRLIFKIIWSTAAAADPGEGLAGGPGSRYSMFRTSNIRRPKGRDLLGLAATRAAARFMGYRRFRRPPLLGERRTALVARFSTIVKILEILSHTSIIASYRETVLRCVESQIRIMCRMRLIVK